MLNRLKNDIFSLESIKPCQRGRERREERQGGEKRRGCVHVYERERERMTDLRRLI